jgi:hypothetical protein
LVRDYNPQCSFTWGFLKYYLELDSGVWSGIG